MRAWFMGKLAREKILLLALLVGGALIWSNDLTARLRQSLFEVKVTTETLKQQALWLGQRERIEGEARAAIENLDSSRTFDGVRLSAEISTLAKQAGIDSNLRSEGGDPQQTAQFSVHQVELTLTRVPWPNLLEFYDALSQRAPYISIERFKLSSVKSDTAMLNASLLVSSVEINQR